MTKAERSSHELQRQAVQAGRQSPWVKARAQGDYVAKVEPGPDLGEPIPADLRGDAAWPFGPAYGKAGTR